APSSRPGSCAAAGGATMTAASTYERTAPRGLGLRRLRSADRRLTRPAFRGTRFRSEMDDRADALAFMHQVESLVDVFEPHRMRDHRVDLDVAVHVLLDHARKLTAALDAAESAAAPHAAGHELE